MHGSGAVSCSCSLLIRGPNLARCQAKAPLIALCRFSKPALTVVLSLQLLSARVDNARVTTSIRDDLRSGAVAFPPFWGRDLRTGIDTWTDCLVLSIATFGQKDLISAVTRSSFLKYSGTDTRTHVCAHLETASLAVHLSKVKQRSATIGVIGGVQRPF